MYRMQLTSGLIIQRVFVSGVPVKKLPVSIQNTFMLHFETLFGEGKAFQFRIGFHVKYDIFPPHLLSNFDKKFA
jgi:hypothetical protein